MEQTQIPRAIQNDITKVPEVACLQYCYRLLSSLEQHEMFFEYYLKK